MEVRPGYKLTEVGVISEEWDATQLGNFISLQRGHDLTWRDRRTGEVPVMGSAGLNGFHNRAVAKGPGVVLGRSGASFGQAHYCEQDFWPHNTALYVTDFRGNDPLFVFYFLAAIDFSRHNSGGAQQSLNRNFIAGIPIGVPRPPEQRAIAAALSDVDALLRGLDRLIAKKRDLKQAAMQQLLTGQTRLLCFHADWDVKTVGELEQLKLVKLSRGQVISKKDINNVSGDYPIYSSSIHNDGLFGRYGKFMFDEELITWSVDGGGNFFHRRKHKFSVTNVCGFMRVDTARIDYRFFAAELQLLHSRKSFDYQSKAHPSVVRKEYEVQLPALREQTAIAAVLSDMDTELSALEARRDKTRALKQGMMQELLTGRTRLV